MVHKQLMLGGGGAVLKRGSGAQSRGRRCTAGNLVKVPAGKRRAKRREVVALMVHQKWGKERRRLQVFSDGGRAVVAWRE